MGRLEDRMSALIVDVRPGSYSDSSHLGGKRIGDVIAVEIQRRHHIVRFSFGEDVLQKRIGDAIVDDEIRFPFPSDMMPFRSLIALNSRTASSYPTFEIPFGELHDVAFVDQGNASSL